MSAKIELPTTMNHKTTVTIFQSRQDLSQKFGRFGVAEFALRNNVVKQLTTFDIL
jgi:hypothetical protein